MNPCNVYDVTLQQIETCVMAASTGSFTSVASALYMTQSAISKQIKTVEERIGINIFTRGRGFSLSLTPAGEVLIREWQELVKDYNFSLISAENEQKRNNNSVVVCVPPSFNTDIFLLPAIMEFNENHPNATVRIQLLSPGKAKQKLVKDSADIVISVKYRRELFDTEDFICTDIANCNWYIGMRKYNLLSSRKELEWQNLRNQKFVIVNDYIFIKMLSGYCKKAGFEMNVGYASPTFSGFADNTLDNKTVFICDPFLHDYNKDGFSYFEMKDSPAGYMMITKINGANQMASEFAKSLTSYAKRNKIIHTTFI